SDISTLSLHDALPILSLQETLELQQKVIDVGNWNPTDLFNILQTQRDSAIAIATEFQAIADYNKALAALEFVKGTNSSAARALRSEEHTSELQSLAYL